MISGTILMVALWGFVTLFYYTIKNGISPMPSSKKACNQVASLVKEESLVIELGCGFGHLALAIARKNKACQVIAYENSPVPFFIAWVSSKLFNIKNLKVFKRNFWHLSFEDMPCIVTYQYRQGIQRLYAKIEQEQTKEHLLISNNFAVDGAAPTQVIGVNDMGRSKLYVYRILLKSSILEK